MGTIISAQCDCGYTYENMYLGGGMRSIDYLSYPNYCKSCKSLFTANMKNKEIHCSNCKSTDILRYDDSSICGDLEYPSFEWGTDEYLLSRENSLCPSCQKFSLKFNSVGSWD